MENHIILVLTGMIVAYHVIQFAYHLLIRVAYLPAVSNFILLVNIVSVILTAGVLFFQQELTVGSRVFFILLLSALTIFNALTLRQNWKKYTVSSFVKNGIYEFEVQGHNRGFVFGRIYWNRKKYPNVGCTGWLYANYYGRSFADRRAEYIKNTKLKVGDIYQVRFVEKACFPYDSGEPNRGNVVKLIYDVK